jgi:hypothetical protein
MRNTWENILPQLQKKRNQLKYMGWTMGIEPTTTGITIQRSTN